MGRPGTFISTAGGVRLVSTLGGLFVVLGAGQAILVLAAGGTLAGALVEFVLIGGPGLGLLYGGYWSSRSDLRPDVYPRIAGWCLAGFGVMLGVIVLLVLNPGGSVDRPFRATAIATAIGSVAGLAIGIYNGRALSRARDAERHRDTLRREHDLRERIVETSPIGILVIDSDGEVTLANEHAAEILGASRDTLVGSEYDELEIEIADLDGNPVPGDVREQILTTDAPVYGVERQLVRADGDRIWMSVNGAPLNDRSGELAAVVFAIEDITERKRLEEDLRETVDQLERSNDRLRQFAFAASHDLQEPLRMVSSYLQLLENRYGDELDADAREFIEFAVDGADRMREMVRDLLTYARLEQGDQEFEPVDCDVVLERVISDLHVRIEESDAEIVAEPLPTVEADEKQLEQLFENLLSNALKYCDDEPRVEIAAERHSDHWEFSVADNGIGIDPDRTDRIFEVFKRLHNDEEYPGTGIGLSLCQKIVQRHGGEIRVESEPGDGSTFSFTLPTTTGERQSAPVARSPTRSEQTGDPDGLDLGPDDGLNPGPDGGMNPGPDEG